MANKAPFPINPALTGIALAYRNTALIADDVFPRINVASPEYKYWNYPIGEAFTIPNTLVGRRGQTPQVEFTATEATGSTSDYGLEDGVPQKDIDVAPPNKSPLDRATMQLTDLILLDREVRAANLAFALGTYSSTNRTTLSGTSQLSDFTNSDPLGVIMAGLDTPVTRPNTMVIGRAAYSKLIQHPKIVQATKNTAQNAGIAARDALAALFELNKVLVGESFLNTAKPGQAVSMSRVWGKHIALLYINPVADNRMGITFGWTAQWGERVAGNWEDKNIGLRGGQKVRVGESVEERVVAADTSYFIQNAVV